MTTRCDQFLQLKVNYKLRSVITIEGQLQHVTNSSDNQMPIITRYDQF